MNYSTPGDPAGPLGNTNLKTVPKCCCLRPWMNGQTRGVYYQRNRATAFNNNTAAFAHPSLWWRMYSDVKEQRRTLGGWSSKHIHRHTGYKVASTSDYHFPSPPHRCWNYLWKCSVNSPLKATVIYREMRGWLVQIYTRTFERRERMIELLSPLRPRTGLTQ